MKNRFYNFLLKSEDLNVYVSCRIQEENSVLIIYDGSKVYEYNMIGYTLEKKKIIYNKNIISCNNLKLECINLDVTYNFENKHKVTNFYGNFKNKKISGKVFYELEQFIFLPYKYQKYICIDFDIYEAVYNLTYIYHNKDRMKLYLKINQQVFNFKKFISIKKNDLNYILKTTKYIFKINNNLTKVTSLINTPNIKICEVNTNISVNIPFSKPFINGTKKKMLLITCNF